MLVISDYFSTILWNLYFPISLQLTVDYLRAINPEKEDDDPTFANRL